jgi:3-isopropylmalate/(R)-2-methylmalate dehydratase large subunit
MQAALVLLHARRMGAQRALKPFVVFPGSGGVAQQIERPDSRLGGESIAEVFRSVGGEIRRSWCGPCFGQGPDALTRGERAITSFNRNWQNRMGVGGEGYLASPAVVAASALLGYMGPPSELGLRWDPETYGI